jgi:hypothetical protein
MTPEELTMHLTPPPGVKVRRYPPWQDQVYRVSLAVAAGALALRGGALVFRAETVAVAGAVLLAASTLVASYTFLVWIDRYRQLVMALAVLGTVLLVVAMPWGVGFLMAAGSVMAAKETHCFRFPTGRIIPWVALAAALTGLVPALGRVNGVGLVVVAALWVPLLWSRFHMRLITVTGE